MEPLLCSSHNCPHLRLPLRREPVQLLDLLARRLGRLFVTTVHRIAELEQEAAA